MIFFYENNKYHIIEPKYLTEYNRLSFVCDFANYKNSYGLNNNIEYFNDTFIDLIENISNGYNPKYDLWNNLLNEFIYKYIYDKDFITSPFIDFIEAVAELEEENKNLCSKIELIENIPRIIYDVNNIYTMVYLDITLTYNELLQNRKPLIINKCENCGRYFVVKTRSDTKYCDNPSPQNYKVTCQKYKTSGYHTLKESNLYKLYNSLYERLKRRTTRHPSNITYEETFQKFKSENEEWEKAVKDGLKTEKEYKVWLSSWV